MGNKEHFDRLKEGVLSWNIWRRDNPDIRPDLSGFDLTQLQLRDYKSAAKAVEEKVWWAINLGRCDLRGADLSGQELMHCKFYLSDLRQSKFRGTTFIRANFGKVDLSDTDLSGEKLDKINLIGANLARANLAGTSLKRASISRADFRYANLRGAKLDVHDAFDAKFHGADLSGFLDSSQTDTMKFGEDIEDFSLLALAFSDGLDAVADPSNRDVIAYLNRAFEYAHEDEIWEDAAYSEKRSFEAIAAIKALLSLYDAQPPADVGKTIVTINAELAKYLAKHPEALHSLHSRQFEELIAEILASHGWQVQLTQATRDGGCDIIGISKNSLGLSSSWLVECKKFKPERKVDVAIVRALYGLRCEQQHGGALLATTSKFTPDAQRYKASRYDLHLLDYHGVIDWLNTYKPNAKGTLHLQDNRLLVGDGKTLKLR